MTAKEKAEELVKKHLQYAFRWEVINATLITVNEIIHQFTNKCCESANRRFWEEVKQEIEKL
jgi:hypothetical protein